MKKLFVLLLMLSLSFGIVACRKGGDDNGDPDDTNPQIAAPTNLAINGEILSWDAVTGAVSYEIYVGGNKVTTVTATSYNFASIISGPSMVFTVVAVAPQGFQNSLHSSSIAYVANVQGAVDDMIALLEDSDLELSDLPGFAAELVRKGMLAAQFSGIIDTIEDFIAEIDEDDSPQAVYQAIDTLVEGLDNLEALLSAIVKTELPAFLNASIDNNEDEIQMYQMIIANEGDPFGYHQDRIDELMGENEGLEEVISMIQSSLDDVVQTALFVVNYLIDIEQMFTESLVTRIINLTGDTDIADLNVTELVLVKDELIDIFRETMPTQGELALVINTLSAMAGIAGQSQGLPFDLENAYPQKTAALMLLIFEASLNYFESLDLAFFTELKAILTSDDSEYRVNARITILLLTYAHNFFEDNKALLEEISDVFSGPEKEALYDDYIQMIKDAFAEGDYQPFTDVSLLPYAKFMAMGTVFEDAFYDLLAEFVAREGVILLYQADWYEYQDEYEDRPWQLQDNAEYMYYNTYYTSIIANEAAHLIDAIVGNRVLADYELVIEIWLEMVGEMMLNEFVEGSELDVELILGSLEDFFDESGANQFALIQNLFAFLAGEDVILEYANAYEELYGDNYPVSGEDGFDYFEIAFYFQAYDEFMTPANRAHLDAILDELEVLAAASGLDETGYEAFIDVARDILDYLDSVSAEVAAFNYLALTAGNKARIDTIMGDIFELIPDFE
ncbi:MAG: hypothetical protein WC225_01690 [Acholeplasmataceae bacterium]|nr:hypothetical protein [Acholeplasmataceae bacterium]